MTSRSYTILTAVVILAASIIRIMHPGGFILDDTFPYCQLAHQFAAGTYSMTADPYYSMRIAFILPLGLSVMIFGDNPFGYFLLPFAANLGAILITMAVAKRFFSQQVAIFTGLFLAFTPLMVFWATTPHPEAMTPLWWALFCYTFMKACDTSNKTRQSMLLVLAGIIVGLSFYNRIFSVVILTIIPLYMLYKREFSFRYLWVAVGLLLAFLVGNSIYYLGSDNFFLRWDSTQIKQSWDISASGWVERSATIDFFRTPWLMFTRSFFSPTYQLDWGFLYYVAIGGTILAWKRHPNTYVPFIWLLAIIIAFDGVLGPLIYFPFTFTPYVLSAALPAAILAALFVNDAPTFSPRLIRVGVIICVLLIGVLAWMKRTLLLKLSSAFISQTPYADIFFIAILSIGILVAVCYQLTRQRHPAALQTIILGLFCIGCTALVTIKSNANYEMYGSTLTGQGGITEAVRKSGSSRIFYLSPKYRPKLIPHFWFKTSFWYNMPKDEWEAEIRGKKIHFALLPSLNLLESGDCILLYKPYVKRFRETSAGAHPKLLKAGYEYPEYVLNPPKSWQVLFDDWENTLYRVQ